MPSCIQEFPNELLAAVFQYLPKSTLKEARLTCTRWSDIGAETLFQRVYFAPRKDIMQRFADITSHPVFGKTITEVVYDSTLFRSRYLDERIFRERYNAIVDPKGHSPETACPYCGRESDSLCQAESCPVEFVASPSEKDLDKSFAHNFRKYKKLQAEQEEILCLGQDLQALCSGLKQASKISKVSLLEYFPAPDYLPLFEVSHAWYCDYSHSNYTGVLAPSRWDTWSNMHLHDTPESYDGHDCDCRGINHLLQAVSTQCDQIQELRIGSSRSRAPLKLFHPSSANTDFLILIVKNLTCLQINCGRNLRADVDILDEELLGVAAILAETPQLETLSISLSSISRRWIHVIQFPTWTRLKSLDLGDLNFTLPSFLSVIEHSQLTLRRLQFRNIWLEGGTSWTTLADRLGEMLKLEHVTLICLVSDMGLPGRPVGYLRNEETPKLAKRMMAWADQEMLEVDGMNDLCAAVIVRVAQ